MAKIPFVIHMNTEYIYFTVLLLKLNILNILYFIFQDVVLHYCDYMQVHTYRNIEGHSWFEIFGRSLEVDGVR